ncbi:hypothetical protein ACFFX0_19465 [Citricoccus parietis]|uniref:Uncharacterized protein n=1 Tax=Citricoccus parietis TaxID=592307 RepID=A0ABV5G2U7_9MICC
MDQAFASWKSPVWVPGSETSHTVSGAPGPSGVNFVIWMDPGAAWRARFRWDITLEMLPSPSGVQVSSHCSAGGSLSLTRTGPICTRPVAFPSAVARGYSCSAPDSAPVAPSSRAA